MCPDAVNDDKREGKYVTEFLKNYGKAIFQLKINFKASG